MAYSTNIDYKAIQNALKPQIDAETDATKKAALQAQYDAAGTSRTEKLASDLNTYGKYATADELNSAAGLQAQNQIGTQYETQAKNINTYFDTAKQNANNDALSRGMARSSYVSDRMANLDTSRASSLTDNDAAKALAIQNAQTSILNNYQTNVANAEAQTYNRNLDRANTLAEYGDTSGYADVGYTPEQITAMNKYIAEQAALKAKKSYSGTVTVDDNGGVDPDNPFGTPTQRTSTYGSSTVSNVNTAINNGFTPQEVMAAAKQKYGVNSKEYQEIVSAVLRQR